MFEHTTYSIEVIKPIDTENSLDKGGVYKSPVNAEQLYYNNYNEYDFDTDSDYEADTDSYEESDEDYDDYYPDFDYVDPYYEDLKYNDFDNKYYLDEYDLETDKLSSDMYNLLSRPYQPLVEAIYDPIAAD